MEWKATSAISALPDNCSVDDIEKLFDFIEEDKYYEENGVEEITDLIDDTVNILNTWKKRIKTNAPKGDVLDEN